MSSGNLNTYTDQEIPELFWNLKDTVDMPLKKRSLEAKKVDKGTHSLRAHKRFE